MILAGFDEAGYGPKLGPLVVAWTAFRIDPASLELTQTKGGDACLWKALKAAVKKTATGAKSKLWVADSKLVRPKKDGLALLEMAAHAFVGYRPTVGSYVEALGGRADRYDAPWYQGIADQKLPAFGAWPGEIHGHAERLKKACLDAGVEFLGAQACVLPEWEFNSGFEARPLVEPVPDEDGAVRIDLDASLRSAAVISNKADVMQREAFAPLLRALRERFPGEAIHAVADKHGGRDYYGPLLRAIFPGATVDALGESGERSHYTVTGEKGALSIRFEPEADSRHFPVALASMICKYLREVFMERLNAWFREHVSQALRPTAGYPGDAERFLTEIEPALPRLGIARERLVRLR